MADKLFLNAVSLTDGRLTLGFGAGTPVVLSEGEKLRDLPDGRAEYAVAVSREGEQFEVRAVVNASGDVERMIAGAAPVPDDWYEHTNDEIEG